MRNFSLSVAGVFTFVAALTVPTYISIHNEQKMEMHASEIEEENPAEENAEETPLEHYE